MHELLRRLLLLHLSLTDIKVAFFLCFPEYAVSFTSHIFVGAFIFNVVLFQTVQSLLPVLLSPLTICFPILINSADIEAAYEPS